MQDCSTCQGTGQRAYGSTSGARGRPGGQVITGDVCDHCWGSGCEDLPGMEMRYVWLELRALREVAEAAREWAKTEAEPAIVALHHAIYKLDERTKGKL